MSERAKEMKKQLITIITIVGLMATLLVPSYGDTWDPGGGNIPGKASLFLAQEDGSLAAGSQINNSGDLSNGYLYIQTRVYITGENGQLHNGKETIELIGYNGSTLLNNRAEVLTLVEDISNTFDVKIALFDFQTLIKLLINKILYNKESDRTIFAVIDYKTGNNIDIDLSNLDDGMHTQLPIYYYLVKNSECITNEFNNPDLIGLYYHKISLKDDDLNHISTV